MAESKKGLEEELEEINIKDDDQIEQSEGEKPIAGASNDQPHVTESTYPIKDPVLDDIVDETCLSYAQYFNINTALQESKLESAIEGMLQRLEMFCEQVEGVREENRECIDAMSNCILSNRDELNEMYNQIDRLHEFVTVVKWTVSKMEDEVNLAEQQLTSSRLKKLLSFIPSWSSSDKSTPKGQGDPSSNQGKPKYNPPKIFNTDDYFGPKQSPEAASSDAQKDSEQPQEVDVSQEEIN